jgi:monothiol glutaredoxin
MIYKQLIKDTVENNKVAVFIKGTAEMPMCGFSARMVELLQKLDVDFEDVNILQDHPQMAIELKEIYGWPTSPQLYIDGKLIGGSDIAIELAESGELQKLLGKEH